MTFFESELTKHIPFKGKSKRKFGEHIFNLTWTGHYKITADRIAKNISMDGDIHTKVVKISGGWAIYTRYFGRK